jgi:uncharacterized membrane protein YkvA (DUF1232 family)
MMRLLRLWRLAGNDLRLLWFAARHPARPWWLFPTIALLVLYALEPINFAVPVFGIVDEFVLLPLALHWILRLLPAEIRLSFGSLRV